MSDWIDCMSSVEPDLLQVNIRSRPFQPGGEDATSKVSTQWNVNHRTLGWTSSKLVLEKKNPFSVMNIDDTSVLNNLKERQPCDICHKSRKFFCYSCPAPLASIRDVVPRVELPVKIDVVKHPGEVEGKSTAVHAKLISPGSVDIHIYPDIPDYREERALLVFPGKQTKTLHQLKGGGESKTFPYDKIVFIDSTWNQCYKISQDPRIRDLPQVMINSRHTMFWRYQAGKPKEYLSTIEAIYYLCVDYQQIILEEEHEGKFDNLLFFFKFMYEKIHEMYPVNQV